MSNSSVNLAALGFGGINTASLVTSLVAIENQPVTSMQNEQSNVQNASSTISSFATDLASLSSAATTLADAHSFAAMTASSSDSSLVATATGSPAAGQWSVSVGNIAQEQRTISNGTADTTSALGLTGTLGVTMGNGQTASVVLSAGMTLSDVANAFAQSGLPLSASTVYDGSQYHLIVSSTSTGLANSITFDESGVAGSGYSLGLSTGSNTVQPALDAHLNVGGVPITSASNLVTNAIPGVSLALTQPTTTPATVTIASNTAAVATQVQAFVTAYNTIVADGHTDAGYGTVAASNPMLEGDSGIRSALDQLGQLMAEQVPGASGAYTSLAAAGVNLNSDGTLAFNQATFTAAMQADPSGITNLFANSSGVMTAVNAAINSLTDPTNGQITAELNAFSTRNQQLASQISSLQLQVSNYQTQLQAEFTNMNQQLAMYKNEASALSQAFTTSSSGSTSTAATLP